jgi:hypothetical protein
VTQLKFSPSGSQGTLETTDAEVHDAAPVHSHACVKISYGAGLNFGKKLTCVGFKRYEGRLPHSIEGTRITTNTSACNNLH